MPTKSFLSPPEMGFAFCPVPRGLFSNQPAGLPAGHSAREFLLSPPWRAWIKRFSLIPLDALQGCMNRPTGMMFPLILDVVHNFAQCPLAKADHSISLLPMKP